MDAEYGDVEGLAHGADEIELVFNLGRRLGTTALVVLGQGVAKRTTGQIEGNGQRAGVLRTHQRDQHRREAVQRVRDDTRRRLYVGGQCEECTKGERHSVQQHEGPLVGDLSQRTHL